MEKGIKFCSQCGEPTPQTELSVPNEPQEVSATQKSRKIGPLRTAFLLVVLLAVLMMFGGCKPKEPSEDEVQQALQQSSPYMDYFDSETSMVEDFTITKRQTTPENSTDVIWVSISVKDDEKSAQLSYVMSYILYNDGWRLENVVRDSESTWEFQPLQGPSDEVRSTCIPENAVFDHGVSAALEQEINIVGLSSDDCEWETTYSAEYSNGYYNEIVHATQKFSFDTENGVWTPSDKEILDSSVDFSPAIGTWRFIEETDQVDATMGESIIHGAELTIDNIELSYSDLPYGEENLGTLTGALKEYYSKEQSGNYTQVQRDWDLSEFLWERYTNWAMDSKLNLRSSDKITVDILFTKNETEEPVVSYQSFWFGWDQCNFTLEKVE